MIKHALLTIAVVLFFLAASTLLPGQIVDLQELVDEAAPGDIVRVPAGTYRVNLILRKGVILEGAGADLSILDGGGTGPVVVGEDGSVIKGFTITNGLEGVKISGGLIGVFENIITGNSGSGIRACAADCVIINNIILVNRKTVGVDGAPAYLLAVNNLVCTGREGFKFWKSPRSTIANNIIAFCEIGINRDEESQPDIFNNILWENEEDFRPEAPDGENLFLDPLLKTEEGVCRLPEDSPVKTMGVPVEGLPEELAAGIGPAFPASLPLPVYLQVMEAAAFEALQWKPLVEYELLDDVGSFGVITSFHHPDFKVGSSTRSTSIEDIVAYDKESLDALIERLVPDEPPAVEVRSWGGKVYPREKDRYVMDSIFIKPESYFLDDNGRLHFERKTNFARIRIAVPEGFEAESLVPEGELESETGIISILNPCQDMIEIKLLLAPIQTAE